MEDRIRELEEKIEKLEQRANSASFTLSALKAIMVKNNIATLDEIEDRQWLEHKFYHGFNLD